MMKIFRQENNDKRGYTLLFAVIVSSLVLAVGISILSISKKEFTLSSSARESAYAFYAADGGLECAMFYDDGIIDNGVTGQNYSTSTDHDFTPSISCGSDMSPVDRSLYDAIGTADGGLFTFYIKTNTDVADTACAMVTVDRHYEEDPDTSTLIPKTTIISRGYNVGWNDTDSTCNDTSPKKVERALQAIY